MRGDAALLVALARGDAAQLIALRGTFCPSVVNHLWSS